MDAMTVRFKEGVALAPPPSADFKCVFDSCHFVHFEEGQDHASDAVRAKPSSSDVTKWCRMAGLSQSFACSLVSLGQRLANVLCMEWCAKMQFLYDYWLSTPGDDGTWDAPMLAAYDEDPTFTAAVSAAECGEVRKRAAVIRSMYPTYWPSREG